mmetsp:Transcript_43917/g.71414  ORF Transcript_43917/g.71414 Transcript_43917/m.71414 type:complete len:200 (+) Transcript_43917:1851-2450(+)
MADWVLGGGDGKVGVGGRIGGAAETVEGIKSAILSAGEVWLMGNDGEATGGARGKGETLGRVSVRGSGTDGAGGAAWSFFATFSYSLRVLVLLSLKSNISHSPSPLSGSVFLPFCAFFFTPTVTAAPFAPDNGTSLSKRCVSCNSRARFFSMPATMSLITVMKTSNCFRSRPRSYVRGINVGSSFNPAVSGPNCFPIAS